MSFIKYSVGQITTVEDQDGVEKREERELPQEGRLAFCNKCGIQHMILQGENERTCNCGTKVRLN